MTVRAVCEKCNHKWDLEMKPMRTITCPNCMTVYNALAVVNDPENKEAMRIAREHNSKVRNKKIKYLLDAIIFIAEKENTAESASVKEIAIEISNILNKGNITKSELVDECLA
jgi:hypothetical protein